MSKAADVEVCVLSKWFLSVMLSYFTENTSKNNRDEEVMLCLSSDLKQPYRIAVDETNNSQEFGFHFGETHCSNNTYCTPCRINISAPSDSHIVLHFPVVQLFTFIDFVNNTVKLENTEVVNIYCFDKDWTKRKSLHFVGKLPVAPFWCLGNHVTLDIF